MSMTNDSDERSLLLALVDARIEWKETSFIFDIDLGVDVLDRLLLFFLDNGFDRAHRDVDDNTIVHFCTRKGLMNCLIRLKGDNFNPVVKNAFGLLPSEILGHHQAKEFARDWEYEVSQTWPE